eukprot:CAMPEP_0201929166 /NCGR_PEP_ID=MMETSP0903-20130614/22426_1 /ASSEMBLY_ACC=CAM_ASM_000552 /TAXON_ID=420261 /ORGANISM="Thalassiosira antarctica, Strain CCMP982" /LENGTH=741 /DNA_ID=CAMNT_0048467863 /DNA_START=1 /DNA_END=2226 /DNA_ORIENTATION=+
MPLQTVYSTPRKRELSSSSSHRADVAAAVGADAMVVASSTSAPSFTTPLSWKLCSLLFVSTAVSSMGPLFVEAVDSPTMPSTQRDRGAAAPNNNGVGSISSDETTSKQGNDNRSSEVVGDERTEKIIQTIRSSVEEDSEEEASSSQYETKSQKQQLLPNRKQRQKQRRQQKQQQQQQTNTQQQREKTNANQQQHHSSQSEYDAYMHWCQKVLGIQSVVEIKEFEYLDHLQIHWDESEAEEGYDSQEFDWLKQYSAPNDSSSSSHNTNVVIGSESESSDVELPTILVRGLAAKHDIQVGDIVISIPLYSLLSVPTTIDHDPVLSRILGPNARQKYGWTNTAEYELPLLVLAVLYHRSLGEDSPISHYIDILLGTSTDSFPFLWSERELREKTGDVGEEVRKMARGIRDDLYEMYDGVMGTLVRERPGWFAPPGASGDNANENEPSMMEGGGEDNESSWIYSYENFQWAFALVISRHHYLPIQDIDDEDDVISLKRSTFQNTDPPSQMQETLSTVSEVAPPANQPTDSWVDLAKNEERVVENDDPNRIMTDDDVAPPPQSLGPIKHSFLAPLADLINFGPPCLTGSYNAEEHVFDLIATCPFTKGQEVTFWYSSDCSDVIIANFGFLHPLVPPCAPPEDWESRSDEWRDTTKLREKELWEVYRNMDLLKEEMAVLESQLVSCDCDDREKKQNQQQQQIDSTMSAASSSESAAAATAEANQQLRIRGRINEQVQINQKMMEELG